MKPITVPDNYVIDGMRRMTLGAPPGLEDSVHPIELLRDDDSNTWWVLAELNEEDIKRGKIWLIVHGPVFQPIAFATARENGETRNQTG